MAKVKDVDKVMTVITPKLMGQSEAMGVFYMWFKNKPNYNPTTFQIAEELGIARQAVSRGFKTLREREILRIERYSSNGQNVKGTPVYKLHPNILDEINGRISDEEKPEPELPILEEEQEKSELELISVDENVEQSEPELEDWQKMPEEECIDIDPDEMPDSKVDQSFINLIGREKFYGKI